MVLALLAAATIFLFVLAIGLTGLRLSPGLLVNFARPAQPITPLQDVPSGEGLIDFFRIALALALVIFPFYLVYMLINANRRKRLLRDVIVFGMILFFFDRLRVIADNMRLNEAELFPETGIEQTEPLPTIQPLSEFVNNPPPIITIIVTVVVVGLLAAIIFGIFWFVLRQRNRDSDAIVRVRREAEEALQTIQAGGNLRDTIIQCYRRMMQAVNDARGIQRDAAVTPREFIKTLTARGIPLAPVRDLTRLFEDARYGHIEGGMRQQLEAVSALEEIVEACRRQGEPA